MGFMENLIRRLRIAGWVGGAEKILGWSRSGIVSVEDGWGIWEDTKRR